MNCVVLITALVAIFTHSAETATLIQVPNNVYAGEIGPFCGQCRDRVQHVIDERRKGMTDQVVRAELMKYCLAFETKSEFVCNGIIDIQLPTVLYILDNKLDLKADRVCSIYFQQNGCTDYSYEPWQVQLPTQLSNESEAQSGDSSEAALKLLHLTDFHYDPDYMPGSNSKCDLPLCCQKDSGAPKTPADAAGYWGDYNVCDMPWHSVLNVLAEINKQHKSIDYIYYTGDIISHRSWTTTRDSNEEIIQRLFGQFAKSFEDVPIYPVLGNHESHPTNYYSPKNVSIPEISTNWLFQLAAGEWSRWLPTKTRATILKGGFYTVLVKPGFRVIALNSNVCFTYNLWLLYDDNDPYDQLKWLVDVLTQAEKNQENVHIISHVPPGDQRCWRQWNDNYVNIVKRFAHTIKAQFNGHTHMDELRFFFDDDKKVVTNVAYNGASFTTFVGFNPNYRMYDLSKTNFNVLDYEQWTYNLTAANQNTKRSPEWFKLYSMRNAYGLENLEGDSLARLVERMGNDSSLVQSYYKYLGRNSEPQIAKGCDSDCLNTLLCSITSVYTDPAIKCGEISFG